MKMGWYQSLTADEKKLLCEMLNVTGTKGVHPGSLIFVPQKVVADLIRNPPTGYIHYIWSADKKSFLLKLVDTCGKCGKHLVSYKELSPKGTVSAGWLCWMCQECSKKELKDADMATPR